MCTFGQGAFLAWKDYGLEKGREEGIEKGKLDNLIENNFRLTGKWYDFGYPTSFF